MRPPDSYSPTELERGLVRSNYLGGMYGGISMAQWHEILELPGVEVAAPIANIGYVMPFEFVPLPINGFLNKGQFQLYRLKTSWLANNATSRYPGVDEYVYYQRRDPMIRGKLLDAVGLAGRADSLPSKLSGGQQQRVAIARALINDPVLLLADEPTGNLDSATGTEIMELILELREDHGMTVLVATHDENIGSRSDKVIRIRDGRLV